GDALAGAARWGSGGLRSGAAAAVRALGPPGDVPLPPGRRSGLRTTPPRHLARDGARYPGSGAVAAHHEGSPREKHDAGVRTGPRTAGTVGAEIGRASCRERVAVWAAGGASKNNWI